MAKIDKTYNELLETILAKGFRYEDPNRKGTHRIQIPSYKFYHEFKDGFPALTTKKLYWRGVVGELIWFLRGDTNIKYLVDNKITIWNKDAYNYYLENSNFDTGKLSEDNFNHYLKTRKEKHHKIGELGRVYGAQWRTWTTLYDNPLEGMPDAVDQIKNLIETLKENPMSSSKIVTAWNPAELGSMALPPCHWSFEILTEPLSPLERMDFLGGWREVHKKVSNTNNSIEEYLDKHNIPKYKFTLKWNQRSVDTFLGLPFNIASYALLAYEIGEMTNMIPKAIEGNLSNVHIYEPHLDAVKEQLSRDVDKYSECSLKVHPEFEIATNAYNKNVLSLDEYFSELRIDMFTLEGYKSYPSIKAEMLAYKK